MQRIARQTMPAPAQLLAELRREDSLGDSFQKMLSFFFFLILSILSIYIFILIYIYIIITIRFRFGFQKEKPVVFFFTVSAAV